MANPLSDNEDSDIRDGKVFALLAYLSLFCIIPLVFKRDNSFVLWHGKQGLILFILQVAVFILNIVFVGLWKPAIFVLGLCSIWGMVEVIKGNRVKLPLIADIAEQITL